MQQQFRIVCRGSRLSRAQADIFKKQVAVFYPEISVEMIIKETKGDTNQGKPLDEMEGKDFFTQDIQDYLKTGQADFAVHSMKDVSGENFFSGTHYAIIDRDDPRDVAIFNGDILDKLASGDEINIGTSSPRRAEMATRFLFGGLPRLTDHEPNIKASPIRGNVDTRLQKLSDQEYDGVILACAGINRLLRSDASKDMKHLLNGKRLMILPLLDCPPAPGQGAIVVETTVDNQDAIEVLKKLNNRALAQSVDQERKVAHRYGSGCHQQFGVIYLEAGNQSFTFAAGNDRNGKSFKESVSMDGLPVVIKVNAVVEPSNPLFRRNDVTLINKDDTVSIKHLSQAGKNWVSETALWSDLAKKGIWVEGSLEGFGIDFITQTLNSPLVSQKF